MTVICVMPTTPARRGFWPGAVRCFLNHDRADAFLLVLNETPEPETPSVFKHPRVSYQHLPTAQRLKTGAKRNMINALVASADIIVHRDDDDWYAPESLDRQLALLESSGKDVVGFHELLYFRTQDRSLWHYRYQGQPPYGSGATLAYRRDYWLKNQFPDKTHSEDTEFALRAAPHMASEAGLGLIVARAHSGNTYNPRFGPAPFTRADRSEFPEGFLEAEEL